ncbi:uncharacterized protein LOC123988995 [Osmia bicornis bicornis]|uniref:uncharacterized protein LOC123988995 n=1 Tax=Osmia bicornis bicornis TaxID=1437191 RepID=UPI001EAF27E4|nr:uncharacterized protein LOC123988995 [Osmia bicornis bicornis]
MTIQDLAAWYEMEGLSLAHHKTEAILLTGRKVSRGIRIRCGEAEINTKKAAKYLGVILEMNSTFRTHVSNVCDKAMRYANSLSLLMPNLGGAGVTARRLYYKVVESVILYAAPFWSSALENKGNVRLLIGTQRSALLRTAQAYRTVSADARCVITGQVPIDLMIEKRLHVFQKKGEITGIAEDTIGRLKKSARDISIERWQQRWEMSTKGR